ncbi:hypothetical protein OC842_004727 [Tilletia horrida]|uniref:Uncharacterized protein n=1 Tax=Tilletia horrida TaxID=155126 RepID=A0AAN6GBP4_9BASI|nr:hypothetical protein OC842_004727 [Tilletia horrida]
MKISASTWLLAVAAVLSLSAPPILAGPTPAAADAQHARHVAVAAERDGPHLHKRGEIHDIMRTISRKGKCGTDFCSTFLHIQPRTKTVTVTKTVAGSTAPSSTVVKTTAITRTASPITRTNSQLSIIAVTPTVQQTIVKTVPFTSTVATITSVVTSTATRIVSTVTSYTDAPVPRKNKERIPDWLEGHCDDSISKACSNMVSTKTCTKTKTVTKTTARTSGVVTVIRTNTVAFTPTTTITVVRTSRSTAAPVTATVKLTSSSLVPVTATVVGTESFYGYVQAGNAAYGAGATTTDLSQALLTTMSGNTFATGGSLIDFPIVDGQTYPFFGATQLSNSGNGDLSVGSSNYVTVANVDQTPAGDPGNGGTSYGSGVYQSAIWNYNPVSGEVTATWTNSDGSPVPNLAILALQANSYMYLTPDAAKFQATYGSFDQVAVYFVPAE